MGALLTDEGELDDAEEILAKSVEEAPRDVNLRINYGKLLADKNEQAKSIKQYEFALLLAPRSPELLLNHANSLKDEGEVEEAIASCRRAIEVKPDFANAYFNLGIVLIKLARILDALNLLR